MSTPSTTESAPTAAPPPPERAAGWRWAPAWVLLFVALWPLPGYAETVLVLGALAAIIRLLLARFRGSRQLLSVQAWALTSALFAAYWLAQLFSSIGAVDVERSLRETLVDLRYLPFLWLAAAAVADPRGRRITFIGLAVIVLVWSADALVETAGGTSPLFWLLDQGKQLVSGHPFCPPVPDPGRISGMFGVCNVKLGVVLASLSPFALCMAARRFGVLGWSVAAALVGLVIAFAGMRAAWLTYALVLLLTGWQMLGWKKALAGLLGGVLALAALSVTAPYVGERMSSTAQLLEGGSDGVDAALSGRLRIWSAALCMIGEHPVSGVGTRGFRSAFADCDPDPHGPSMWGPGPAFHAHQIVLEVASETGLTGLLLWLAAAALAWRAWRFAPPAARDQARPAMLALAVTVFPLNTHLAFYSTMWGGLTLLLAALYAGSLLGTREHAGHG